MTDAAPPAPSPALIEAELARLAASPVFRRSPRHVRFLRHLVACTLEGDGARLRELALGVEVFLRHPARFDPKTDSIVRVEARRLRHKLARYYAEDGEPARLQFVLEPGRYDVALLRREPAARARGSVAVYEFAAPARADDAPLAVQLAAELAATTARLNGLRVVRAGAPPPGGDDAARAQARSALKVDHLLLGALEHRGGDWLLGLRLLRASDGHSLWTREAVLPADEPMGPLETLARGVVTVLHRDASQRQLQRVRLAGPLPLLRALAAEAPDAEVLEWLGLARIALRQSGSLDACRKAVAWCERAVLAAPGHAPAWALLSVALTSQAGLSLVPAKAALTAAREAAERALALDPELVDAHSQLGQLLFIHQHDWPAAERQLLAALQRGPAQAQAHARYAWALMMNRRFDEALACYGEALDLDPLSLRYRVHQALVHLYRRDWARSDQGLAAVIEVEPGNLLAVSLRAALRLYEGRFAEGLAAYEHTLRLVPEASIGRCGRAQALALLGRQAEARDELARLTADHASGQATPYEVAMVHARLGDETEALRWLERSATSGDFNYVCVGVDPAFDGLRAGEAGRALLRRTGFAHLT